MEWKRSLDFDAKGYPPTVIFFCYKKRKKQAVLMISSNPEKYFTVSIISMLQLICKGNVLCLILKEKGSPFWNAL
jgi:hypothetical protein